MRAKEIPIRALRQSSSGTALSVLDQIALGLNLRSGLKQVTEDTCPEPAHQALRIQIQNVQRIMTLKLLMEGHKYPAEPVNAHPLPSVTSAHSQ